VSPRFGQIGVVVRVSVSAQSVVVKQTDGDSSRQEIGCHFRYSPVTEGIHSDRHTSHDLFISHDQITTADVPCRKEQDVSHMTSFHPSLNHLRQSSTLLSLYDRSSTQKTHWVLSEVFPAEVRVMKGPARMYVQLTL